MADWHIHFENEESPAGNNLVSISLKLSLNGIEMPDILNVDGWYEAVKSEGKKELFTCACGDFGCGGYYMKVVHTNEGISLINRYSPLDENELLETFEVYLSWEDVFWIYTEAIDYIDEVRERNENSEICTGTYGPNLLEKLDEYYSVFESLRSKFE